MALQADPADLALAIGMADRADALTLNGFRRSGLVVETKPDRTPVTEIDRTVEQLLRRSVGRARPHDSVLGEEYGVTGHSRRRWVVDPIDGTANYLRGVPVWATLVALEVDGEPLVGVVSAPALGRRWWAGRGLGAFAGLPGSSGSAISVSAVARLEDAQVSYASLSDWEPHGGVGGLVELTGRCWRSRGFGDFWSHMLVAEGSAEIGLDPVVSHWDLAALQVVVEEAGGRFTDLGGRVRPDGGSAISSNGLLHEEALGILIREAGDAQR